MQEQTVKLRLRTQKGGTIKDEVSPDSDYQLQATMKNMLLKAGGYESLTAEWEEEGCICTFTVKRKGGSNGKGDEVSGTGRKQAVPNTTVKTGTGQKGSVSTSLVRTGQGRVSEPSKKPVRESGGKQGNKVPVVAKPTKARDTGGTGRKR
jgi:hypothetical protein